MQPTKIEYADLAWNPVKGLCPAGCLYCYAKKFYDRFWKNNIKTEGIYLDDEELSAPLKRRKPARIFVCTTIELFHEETIEYAKPIFKIISECSRHTFLLLTKYVEHAECLSSIGILTSPPNLWLGVTITRQVEVPRAYRLLKIQGPSIRWISFEPLLEPVWDIDLRGIDWIVLGRLTGRKGTGPAKPRWFEEIIEIADKAKVPVFMKKNLISFWRLDTLRQSYPKVFYEPNLKGLQ